MKGLASNRLFFAVFLLLSIAACKFGAESSPTATLKTFYEAQKNKDIAAYKRTLSKSSLDILESTAREFQKKTFDESMQSAFNDPNFKAPQLLQTRNERIEGDSATLEYQDDESKKWETMYFIKAGGEWKIAFDKYLNKMD